jgi:hypothetical protein
VLAVSRPKKGLQWLLSQLPRYYFCGIYENELEGLALMAQGQNHFFLADQPSTTSFAITYTGVVTLRRDILGFFVHPFVTLWFYCVQDCTWECASAHGTWMLPLVDLPESYSLTLWVASEKRANQTKVLAVRN